MMRSQTQNIAVVGAGLMGAGIVVALGAPDRAVALFDPDSAVLASAPGRIEAMRGQLDPDDAGGLPAWVTVHDDLATAVRHAEIVIEAGPENLDVKREIFTQLGRLSPPGAILATNTSAIPIAEIAAGLDDESRVVGAHFWNPPHLVHLVEIVEAVRTNPAVVETMFELLNRAGMRPVHVRADIPGFIGNRLQHALKREAIAIVAAGHCNAADVDEVVRYGFGVRLAAIGPLEQSDLLGLGLTLAIHERLMPDLDRTPVAHPLLVEKVKNGETGAAVGRGFRDWTDDEAAAVRQRVDDFLVDRRKRELAVD